MPSVQELLSYRELIDYTKVREPQKKKLEELLKYGQEFLYPN